MTFKKKGEPDVKNKTIIFHLADFIWLPTG